uniref:Secreted protein n=1 Tax=Oncorhynchus mykiss TaxID=8022 RepID=A0A8C7NHW7_ONCMY
LIIWLGLIMLLSWGSMACLYRASEPAKKYCIYYPCLPRSRMSFPWTFSSPPFHYMLRASGQSEVWSDARPEDKFHQYGWRCGTSEDGYGTRTLIGNWVEQQKDITQYRKARPLPSQVRPLPSQVRPQPSQVRPLPSQLRFIHRFGPFTGQTPTLTG